MSLLYDLGIRLYGAAIALAALRSPKARLLRRGQARAADAVGRGVAEVDKVRGDGPWVWFHAASLGEFEQGRPLIERLRRRVPRAKVLLTFFSPSGYEVRKNYDGADVVAYLPLDTPAGARRLLDAVHPAVAVFIKYEFWGNMLRELRRRGVPVFLVSAIFRPGQIFFRPWGREFRRMLRHFTRIYVQDSRSQRLLEGIGLSDRVRVAGDTRFDRVTDVMAAAFSLPAVEAWAAAGGGDVLVAGSTWPRDEENVFAWLRANPEVKAVIAPHEFDDARIDAICRALGTDAACRLSRLGATPRPGLRYIVVDSFGKLSGLYRYATMAYVGGGFGAGIHNINEAAVYGVPVVFGPRHSRFKEAADLIDRGAAFAVDSAETTARTLSALAADHALRDKAGRAAAAYIKESIGASDRIFPDLLQHLAKP